MKKIRPELEFYPKRHQLPLLAIFLRSLRNCFRKLRFRLNFKFSTSNLSLAVTICDANDL